MSQILLTEVLTLNAERYTLNRNYSWVVLRMFWQALMHGRQHVMP